MVLNRSSFFILLFLLGISPKVFSQSALPELITKQSINNLRFLSHDGQSTYYQRRSGTLLHSTNYTVKKVLTGSIGVNYIIYASPARKKLLIEQEEHYHTFFSPRVLKKIYSIDYHGHTPKFLGEGINSRLHLNDSWVSYYNPYKKVITLKNIKSPVIKQKIKIKGGRNPYFAPYVVMIDMNTAIFTDMNKDGIPSVIQYTKNNKTSKTIYTVPSYNKKIELCLKKDQLFVGEFGFDTTESYSSISVVPIKKLDFSKKKIIYTSHLNDIGNIVCTIPNDSIYFIKNISNISKKERTEVARLKLKDNAIAVISDIFHATQIIDMDAKLLLPYQGKHYVLLGENNTARFDLLKSKGSK